MIIPMTTSTIIFTMLLQLARAQNWYPNTTVGSALVSSPLLANVYTHMPSHRHPSGKHVLSIQQLMKTLQWNHTIVFFDPAYSDDDLQFLLPVLGLTSVYDLGDLRSSIEVKQLLQQLHKKFFPRLNFLLLSNYSRVRQILQIVDQYDLKSNRTTEFRHHSFWVVGCYSPCQPEKSVLSYINHLENVVLIATLESGCSGLQRLITTSGGRSFSPVTEITGIKDGDIIKDEDIFPNRKYDLNRRKLIVSTMKSKPFVMKKGNEYEGYLMDVLDSIASTLNFSYKIVHPEDMRWGEIIDGRWDGLVGQLQRREVDLVIASLSIHDEREKVMDFLYPPVLSRFDDIMYNFEADESRWQIFLKPFSYLVFLILCVTLVASTVIGYILLRCDDVITGKERNTKTLKARVFTLADVFLYMFGMLITRALASNPRSHSTRLLLFTWGLFSVIITACYSANLVAIFTVQKPNLPFKSLGELVRQKEYKWGFVSGDIREHIFNRSRSGDMKLAWEGILEFNKTDPDVLSQDTDVHLAKLKKEKYALVTNRLRIEKMKRNDCNIHRLGQDIIWHQVGLGVPTDYPLKKELENVLGAVVDSGLTDIWWQRWNKRKANVCIKDRSINGLTLTDVVSIFFLLCVGLGAAGLVLVIEFTLYKLQHRQLH